ncbi:chemotaxis protein methyltransferase CheR [Desulfohalotomaculum tongense]|uniref:CheR family methyltransferase n=1 Tax=Desulforadius tongensis TaxID=1216062 RepID=UPI00195D30F8|nr:protein-glutamate O-methyltransferase CheR [Desulforadius tongensis]MBM7854233.1 chemotaxis protein methyltransferase CheR [Desulforadius tongensis]
MDFMEFKNRVYKTFGLDLHSYKENQLQRRLNNLLVRKKLSGFGEYFNIISQNRQEYTNFLDYLTINVSEFFRDVKMFKILEDKVLPELLLRNSKLKIWSAACSIGAEPYSVAIILDELTPGRVHQIEATDLDQNILQRAKEGKYNADAVKNVTADRLSKYFVKQGDKYLISPQIKNKVQFRQHDLLKDNYPRGYDLILCRNVTIYFTRQAQEKVNRRFVQSLKPGGCLFIGGSETIFNYAELGLDKISPCFYRKVTRV